MPEPTEQNFSVYLNETELRIIRGSLKLSRDSQTSKDAKTRLQNLINKLDITISGIQKLKDAKLI